MLNAEWLRPLDFKLIRRREVHITLADFLAKKTEPSTVQALSALKARFRTRTRAQHREAVVPLPEARYDEVLLEGLRMADASEEEA